MTELYLFELKPKFHEDKISKNINNLHVSKLNLHKEESTKTNNPCNISEIVGNNNDADAEKKIKIVDVHSMKVEDNLATSPPPDPAKPSAASRTASPDNGPLSTS